MNKSEFHNKYLIENSIFECHGLGELWNACGKNIDLLLM